MTGVNAKRFAIIKDGLGWLVERNPPRWGSPIGAKLYEDQDLAERTAAEIGGRTTIVVLKGEQVWP